MPCVRVPGKATKAAPGRTARLSSVRSVISTSGATQSTGDTALSASSARRFLLGTLSDRVFIVLDAVADLIATSYLLDLGLDQRGRRQAIQTIRRHAHQTQRSRHHVGEHRGSDIAAVVLRAAGLVDDDDRG